MSDLIKKTNGNVTIGERYCNLVLKTLGRVYIETGNSKELLDDLIKRIVKASDEASSSTNIETVETEKDLESLEYPGDNQFVFVTSTKNLYITVGGQYIPIASQTEEVEIDWSNIKGNYVKLTGDKMSGDLTAPNLIAKEQLQSKTYTEPPLKVNSDLMVKNLNSEYLNGKKWDELARKNENEDIGGSWNFKGVETFNQNTIFNSHIGSKQFSSGFSGVGWRLNADSNTLTIDNLVVRKAMRVYEMIVSQIKATNGSLWVSDSGTIKSVTKLYPVYDSSGNLEGKPEDYEKLTHQLVEDVDEHGNPTGEYVEAQDELLDKTTYLSLYDEETGEITDRYIYDYYFDGAIFEIELEDELTPFWVNDIIRCQRYYRNNITYYDAVVINTDNGIYIRLARAAEDLVGEDGDSGDEPQEDHDLVRIGNISNTDRQGAIYLTSSDDMAPYIDILNTLNRPDYSTILKCVKLDENGNPTNQLYNDRPMTMRIGRLDGIYDDAFGLDQPKGMGMYGENVYIKGRIVQVQEGKEYLVPIYKGEYSNTATYYYYNYVYYNNRYYLMVNKESISGIKPDAVFDGFTPTDNKYNIYWDEYLTGTIAVNCFTSYVFQRSETKPERPTGGGSYKIPYPYYITNGDWSDGIPEGEEPIWMTFRVFYSDDRETDNWSEPVLMSGVGEVQVKYSEQTTKPLDPTKDPTAWSDTATTDTIWMAMRTLKLEEWSEWEIIRVKGEDGEDGDDGLSVLLTNESHQVVVDSSGYPIANLEMSCSVQVYKGGKIVTPNVEIIEDQPGVIATVSGTTVSVTFSQGTKLESCELPLRITVGDIETRRVISIITVTNGKDASYVNLSGDQWFVYSSDGTTLSATPTPETITLTANLVNCKVKDWLIRPLNGSYDSQGVTTDTFKVTPTASYWNSQKVITVKCLAIDGENQERYDEMTISKVSDGTNGENAYSVVLSNDTHSVAVDQEMYPEENETMTCTVQVYKGATLVTDNVTISVTGVHSGITYTLNGNILIFTFIKNKAINSCQISVKVKVGNKVEIDKTITITAVKNGSNGESAGVIHLSGDNVFLYTKKGTQVSDTPTPTSITLTANPIRSTIKDWLVKTPNSSYTSLNTIANSYTVNPTDSYWNNGRIITVKVTATDEAGNDLYDEMTITKLYDGVDGDVENGVEGAVLRVTEWSEGFYYNDGTINENGTKYKDIVTITNGPKEYYAFECLEAHKSTADNKPQIGVTTDYWYPMNQMMPIYTPLIFAENARFYMAASNEIAVLDKDENVIAALSGSNETHTIWSGGATPEESNFSVTKDGKLSAKEATIEGSFKIKAKNDERSITLQVDEYETRSSSVEDPVIKITDSEGEVVTELNGNEYTDPGSELNDETGSLNLTYTGSITYDDTVIPKSMYYYRETSGDIDLTDILDYGKNLKVALSGLRMEVDAKHWNYEVDDLFLDTIDFTTAGDMCRTVVIARLYARYGNGSNTQIAYIEKGFESYASPNSNSAYGGIVYNDTQTTGNYSSSWTETVNVDTSLLFKDRGSFKLWLRYNIYTYSNKETTVAKAGTMDGQCPNITITSNSFKCNYEISGYASKYFANGLILGTKNSNSVQLYNNTDKMTAKFMSDGQGLVVDSTGVKYNSIYNTYTQTMPLMVCLYNGVIDLSSKGDIAIFGVSYEYSARSSNQSYLYLSKFKTNTGIDPSELIYVITPVGAYAQTGVARGDTTTIYSTTNKIQLTIYILT